MHLPSYVFWRAWHVALIQSLYITHNCSRLLIDVPLFRVVAMSNDREFLLTYPEHKIPLTQLYRQDSASAIPRRLDDFVSLLCGDLNEEAVTCECSESSR